MMNNSINSNKIKENKYKILRMSLLLGNGEDKEETINNFEDAAREIDSMNDEIYLQDLEKKFYDTLTLEEEEKKLDELVDYIGGRVEQRMSLLIDFSNVTGYELVNLPIIKYQDKLDEYKDRLGYIKEYLSNVSKIEILNGEISDLEKKLDEANISKEQTEVKNVRDEEELLRRFSNIIKNIDTVKDVTVDTIEDRLASVSMAVADSKKSLDIFDKSYATLNQVGLSGDEKAEYLSYVSGAKELYYNNKEEEFLLNLFKLFNSIEKEYSQVLMKRNMIKDIINERLSLREDLNVKSNDVLSSIYDFFDRQYDSIKSQKFNIDNIEEFSNEIDSKKNMVLSLENDNQKVEILSLLREFCIIDTYEDSSSDMGDITGSESATDIGSDKTGDVVGSNSDVSDIGDNNFVENDISNLDIDLSSSSDREIETKENNVADEIVLDNFDVGNDSVDDSDIVKDNQIISIDEVVSIDVNEAIIKSNNVMKRVGEMLGVKIDDSKLVTVKDENIVEEASSDVLEDTVSDNTIDNSVSESLDLSASNDSDSVDVKEEIGNVFLDSNYDADPENNVSTSNENEISNMGENPLFDNILGNSTLDEVLANGDVGTNDNDEFWNVSEEKPLDLNQLPDIDANESNDNLFFQNDGMSDLSFPELNFNLDDKEGK